MRVTPAPVWNYLFPDSPFFISYFPEDIGSRKYKIKLLAIVRLKFKKSVF